MVVNISELGLSRKRVSIALAFNPLRILSIVTNELLWSSRYSTNSAINKKIPKSAIDSSGWYIEDILPAMHSPKILHRLR